MFLPFLVSGISKKDKVEILVSITKLPIEDLIDLSLAIIVVKKKSLKVLGVKKSYNDNKLYYYYNQNYPNMMVKICPNKDKALQSSQFLEIEDN